MESIQERLHNACWDGDVQRVKQSLENPQININWQDCRGWTPLYSACFNERVKVVKILLNDERIDINKAESGGRTPFWIACEKGQIEIAKLLLSDERINMNNQSYRTPFYLACLFGLIEIVKFLLNNERVDVNKIEENGQIPFHAACYQGHIEIVKLLLASEREVGVNTKNMEGKTAIELTRVKANTSRVWETEQELQERKRKYSKVIELLESFKKNPNETRAKLRMELGFVGMI